MGNGGADRDAVVAGRPVVSGMTGAISASFIPATVVSTVMISLVFLPVVLTGELIVAATG